MKTADSHPATAAVVAEEMRAGYLVRTDVVGVVEIQCSDSWAAIAAVAKVRIQYSDI